ncbi:MAG: hypothetical protein AAGF11_37075 [Myxococcota bacterium]
MLGPLEAALDDLDPATVRRDPDLRAALLLELALAHDGSFAYDVNVEHLRLARALLDRLVAETEQHGYAASLVDQALAMRDRIDDRLLNTEAAEDGATVPPTNNPRSSLPPTSATTVGRGWWIAGWTLSGLSLGLAATSAAGLGLGAAAHTQVRDTRRPQDEPTRITAIERGRRSNQLALGAGIAASALLVGGVTALVVGTLLRRRARRERTTRGEGWSPLVGTEGRV